MATLALVVLAGVHPAAAAVWNSAGAMETVTWSGDVRSLVIGTWLVMAPLESQL